MFAFTHLHDKILIYLTHYLDFEYIFYYYEMDRKESPYDLRDPSRAPEVAYSYSPIPVVRESEGLQLGYDHSSGKEAVADERSLGSEEQSAQRGDAAVRRPKWYRRKRWMAAVVLAAIAVVAVAVGAGVGASARTSGKDSSTESQDQSQR